MKYLLFLLILFPFDNLFSEEIYQIENAYAFGKNIPSNPSCLSCLDEINCILLRTDDNGTGIILEKTTDGGFLWTKVYADTSFKSSDSAYYPHYRGENCKYNNNGTIIIVTSNGKIIRSDDFGDSFTKYPIIDDYKHHSFIMLDPEKALTSTSIWSEMAGTSYHIMKSSDSCKSWQAFPVPTYITNKWNLTDLILQKDNSIIMRRIVKKTPNKDTMNYFYHTDFEGSFWKLLEVPKHIEYIYYLDENEAFGAGNIYVTIYDRDTTIVCKTYDDGKTWEFTSKTIWPKQRVSSYLVHNDSHIIISGSWFGFRKSTDKGNSWFKPEFQIDSDIKSTNQISNVQAYFDSEILYFYTVSPSQLLRGTKVISSVNSPSVKPKRIFPNPVTYGSDFVAEYEIATSGHLKMYLSDLSGREVCPFYSDFVESGSYSTSLRLPENIISGSYWLVSEQNGYKHVQLLNVVK
ncbi:MAG: hypothetical protein M9949_11210 [Candidatus Kapabacteria bacterium]|nr:hypothetical protein [Candidatus Kapabacteria bacterium]